MVMVGWVSIYAAVYDPSLQKSILDFSLNSGKQVVWLASACVLIILILIIDFRSFETLAYFIYALALVLLVTVLLFGKDIAGSRSWFDFGFFRFQPSEFAKFATALALSKYIGSTTKKINSLQSLSISLTIIGLPAALIVLQGDAGTALVFTAFIFLLYREGLPSGIMLFGFLLVFLFIATLFLKDNYLWHFATVLILLGSGIAFLAKKIQLRFWIILISILSVSFVFSTNFVFTTVLKPHQQRRIEILFNPESDIKGAGWQVNQSKIAIGSGGLSGKGFLKGTQTKFDFVPDQSTDFIFCTIGEEYGWIGTSLLSLAFLLLIFRIIALAERQKARFSRVYGYGVAGILFFHYAINIGMTIGLFPVIGIPLPFFSYGGSSLWAFTILLFTFLKLDAHRMEILAR